MQRDILSATDEYSYQLFSPSSLSFMADDVLKPRIRNPKLPLQLPFLPAYRNSYSPTIKMATSPCL